MKPMNILLLTCFFYMISPIPLLAKAVNPGKVDGSVTDGETYNPVPGARVELIKLPDSARVQATISNSDGKYQFENVALGKYFLKIACLSYRLQMVQDFEITAEKPVVKFGTTNLLTESKNLKEVTITGYKLTGLMDDDKTIYTVNSKAADIAQSGLELLRQLPDVTVGYMSNEVKLAGKGNILFLVNGKKVDVNYLLQLNPKLVDKIEVSTNPGAKYDSDVDAVINILLKRNMQYGLSSRIRADLPTGNTILSRGNVNLDFYRKTIRLFASGNFRLQRFEVETFSDRLNTLEPGQSSELRQDRKGITINKRGGFSYGLDWFPDDNNTLNFYSSVQPVIPNENKYVSDIISNSTQTSYHNTGINTNTEHNQFQDYSVFFKHKFAGKNHDISFESYVSNRNAQTFESYYEHDYVSADALPDRFNQLYQGRETGNKQFMLKVDYNYPVTEKIKFSAGYSGNFNRNNYSYEDKIAGFIDYTMYNEDRHAGYTNISWNLGNLNLQTGMRYELSDINLIHAYDTLNRYNYFLPSLSAQYKLGKLHTFRLNYRKYVTRPGVSQLSPTNYRYDVYTQSVGNPALKPYVNFISNGIRQITLNSTDSVVRQRYSNVSNDLEYGVTLSGTFDFVKWWELSTSYTNYRHEMQALPAYGINDVQKRSSWRLNISSNFKFPKEWVGFIEYNYASPYHDLQSKNSGNYEFVVGFYKPVNKKLNITVISLNPWGNRYVFNKSETRTPGLLQNTEEGANYSYVIMLRVGYNFNIGKEGKKVDRQRDSEENSDPKKGMF